VVHTVVVRARRLAVRPVSRRDRVPPRPDEERPLVGCHPALATRSLVHEIETRSDGRVGVVIQCPAQPGRPVEQQVEPPVIELGAEVVAEIDIQIEQHLRHDARTAAPDTADHNRTQHRMLRDERNPWVGRRSHHRRRHPLDDLQSSIYHL